MSGTQGERLKARGKRQGYPNIFGVMDKENNKCPFLEDNTNNISRQSYAKQSFDRMGDKNTASGKRESRGELNGIW